MAAIANTPSKQNLDPYLIVFNAEYDAGNPKDWPTSRKWAVTDVLSATGFNRIMVSTIMAPALSTIAKELDMNTAESVMALSIYLLATAFGPLVIGPLSEIYGRQRILHTSNVWFLVWNIACGFASTKGLLIAARFLAGFGASSIFALAGGVLGDVWSPEQRGKSLGIYLLIPLLGAAVGPIIGGFMAARTTWRWMFWSTSIFQGVMILVSFTTFRETYAPLILKSRAEKLRQETGNQQYQTVQERDYGHKSALSTLGRALTRPMRLILFHPIIQITSVISAFYYGILYILLSTFSQLWVDQYHQSVEISGLHYIACALGEVAGAQIGGPLMDHIFRRMQAARSASSRDVELYVPEFRIPLMFPGAFLVPLGLLLYGWAAQYRLHWLVVDTGIFLVCFGMQIAGMPLTAYVMDAYMEHTSSAAAATQFLKSLTAFLFPLFAPKMYQAMGYGWGSSSMAFAGLIFGFPAPLILWFYGAKLRAKNQSSY
ncbi:major facilitator superfamily domain-containing protein [Dactylonectria macrodidyma]|uniref:Major facilitator superfamily domain-containing protein n=1 Tax=Dactylonectria macrodidyma TaxID=307937 RepID=A0A9P9FHW7_9HYPO|nr:major facilitator superfamily domain-containing protein [Dactylonectria macrodidyma]